MPGLSPTEIFQPGGILQASLPNYEYRGSQLLMAEAVLDAINNRQHLCVEAGTGTGKTLAYLIPVLFSKKRVIISTATKNLQEQLFLKDIPFIREHFFPELKATYMNGRKDDVSYWFAQIESREGSTVGGPSASVGPFWPGRCYGDWWRCGMALACRF